MRDAGCAERGAVQPGVGADEVDGGGGQDVGEMGLGLAAVGSAAQPGPGGRPGRWCPPRRRGCRSGLSTVRSAARRAAGPGVRAARGGHLRVRLRPHLPCAALVHRDRSGHRRSRRPRSGPGSGNGGAVGFALAGPADADRSWGQVTLRASQSIRKAACGRAGSGPAPPRRVWWVPAPTGPSRVMPWSLRAVVRMWPALRSRRPHMPGRRQSAFIQVLVVGLSHLDIVCGRVGGLHVRDHTGCARLAGPAQVEPCNPSSQIRT